MTNCEKNVYSKDALLVTDDEIFSIQLYDENLTEFKRGVAYLNGDYYYLYRGEMNPEEKNDLYPEPGVYKNPKYDKTFLIEPYTPDDKKKYSCNGKVSTIDPNKIIDVVNNKEEILIAVPESTKIFLPSVNTNDDILKRIIKKALIEKGIDLDQYKNRFIDRNALFNFKSSIKKDECKLSMLLFDRGCEALNLKYTITLEEKDPSTAIGNSLSGKITANSDDTFDR